MNTSNDVTELIINTINNIFEKLFSSIDNQLYSILDDITFVNSDILSDNNFEKLFGSSTSNGILLIANSLLFGFILYYSIKYLISHITYQKVENPTKFLFKLIFFGIFMNFSFVIMQYFLDFNSYISSSIRGIGEYLFHKNICFSELILMINKSISFTSNDIFSIDGFIKSTLSISLLNLIFSYSFRFIMLKIFILLTPFAFLSASLDSTSWFFKSWFKNIFALLFIQHIVSLVLLILFSLDFSNTNLLNKFIYLGGIYSLIKANSFVREFIGGVSTNVSQYVHNFSRIHT